MLPCLGGLNTVHNLNNCTHVHSCACADRWITQPYSLNREGKHATGEITLVNASETLSGHSPKLREEKVPMRLDGYLEV